MLESLALRSSRSSEKSKLQKLNKRKAQLEKILSDMSPGFDDCASDVSDYCRSVCGTFCSAVRIYGVSVTPETLFVNESGPYSDGYLLETISWIKSELRDVNTAITNTQRAISNLDTQITEAEQKEQEQQC